MANLLFAFFFSSLLHPYFVSQSHLFYDKKEKELQLTSQYFLDDFENALSESLHKEKIIIPSRKDSLLEKKIRTYILQHIQLRKDDSLCTLHFLGYEIEHDNIIIYLFAENISSPQKTITLFNDMLYAIKERQTHLLNFTWNGKESSARIMNPTNFYTFYLESL